MKVDHYHHPPEKMTQSQTNRLKGRLKRLSTAMSGAGLLPETEP